MRIHTRVSLWYACILAASLILMTGILYFELVVERRLHAEEGRQREPIEREIAEVVVFYGAPTALLLLVGGWILMRRALVPLDRLTRAAERIHANTLHERLPRSMNNDELDRLTDVFNTMISRLDDSFSRIREFTLHASHELKTPLTVLHVGLETMMNEPSTAPAQRDELAGHLDEIQRLARIVQNLSLLTKADSGQIALLREPVRLDELMRDSFADAQILAQPHGIQVELTNCENVVVTGDRHRLRQLLLNLTENAVKHNQPGGSISMALRGHDRIAELAITNTGAGILPEKLPRVFERFYRGDPSKCDDTEGCGLGLSIVEWIARIHNGNIRIVSTPLESTSAILKLPLRPHDPTQGEPSRPLR